MWSDPGFRCQESGVRGRTTITGDDYGGRRGESLLVIRSRRRSRQPGSVFSQTCPCLLTLIHLLVACTQAAPNPPIEIPLTLARDAYVTLVIEDDAGNRVRNLVSETLYEAGEHTLYWDGMDDHGCADVGPHGNYTTTGSIVAPGTYRVRGIMRDKVELKYEFSVYNPVNPPWRTPDTRGQWLADHTPPSSVLYVPGEEPHMLIGSSLAEGAHGLVWTDPGGKKIRGVQGIGGGWAGAVRLKLDVAGQPDAFTAYGLGASRHGQISLVGIGERSNKTLFTHKEEITHHKSHYIGDYPIGGLAVYNGLAAISYPNRDEIAFIEIDPKATLKEPSFRANVTSPKGLAFDKQGRFYVLDDNVLKRYRIVDQQLENEEVIIDRKLDDPREIIIGDDGQLYIADHGNSHQVKVFAADGTFLRAIGKPGQPACGPYDESKMHHPMGMTLTPSGDLWVAEEDYQPKRISIWSADGSFKKAFYGPTEYGGGGKLDPTDKTRFYYFGMEFELDWEQGTARLKKIFFRRDNPDNLHIPNKYGALGAAPETPIYLNGRQYMTSTYNGRPTMGPLIAGVWLMEEGVAQPVAAVGQANYWQIFKGDAYSDRIPDGIDLNAPLNQQWTYDRTPPYENALLFAWSDLNNDHDIQPDEVTFAPGKVGGLNQDNGLTFHTADGLQIAPQRFTGSGVPVYDLAEAKRACPLGVPLPYTVVIPGRDGDFAVSGFPSLARGEVSGVTRDGRRWTYPSQWTGLHASQSYPVNRGPRPGEIIGTTKVIGPTFTVADGREELWALNANSGQIYLFTIDGLFVASLFKHGYFCSPNPPHAERGMTMNDYTSDGEGFYQTITRTADGKVYLQAMNHTSSLIQLEGLDSLERLPEQNFSVSKEALDDCIEWFSRAELARQQQEGKKEATVPVLQQPPVVDGELSDWAGADWLPIDDRTFASLRMADDHLYVAWKTLHRNLLSNTGADPWQGMFKTGGALDLMLSTTGNAERQPKPGDQRILISQVNGKIRAIHYEQRSTREGHPGEIASPNRTVPFDYIADVSDRIRVAEGVAELPYQDPNVVFRSGVQYRKGTSLEVAIPLNLLALEDSLKSFTGDVGILLGNGTRTIKRLYWSNKNTAMLFDAPEESLLKPALWGGFDLVEVIEQTFEQALQTRADKVEVLSNAVGKLDLDASAVAAGSPSAVIDWSGEGSIVNREIGRGGYIVFRHQASDWFHAVEPLQNLASGFTFSTHNPGRFPDGLHAGGRAKSLQMSIDGTSCGKIYGGSLWGQKKETQSASWDLTATDGKTHQLTLLLGIGAKERLLLAPLDQPEDKRELVSFDGSQGMSIVQFNFTGDVRLTLEQAAYTEDEIKKNRPPANITAIFLD